MKKKWIIAGTAGAVSGIIWFGIGRWKKREQRKHIDSQTNGKKTDKRPHILLISQYFYPETFRVNDIAAEWVKRGYKVTVLTGIPNYPMGKFFDEYNYKNKRMEHWNGVEILRIPLVARGNSSNKLVNAIGMSANYLSFVASGHRWVKSKQARELNVNMVFTVEVSPMTQALIGCWYGKKYHVPHYLYVQDLWPENVEAVTRIHSPVILKPIGHMVDWIYKNTDQIFTASPSFTKAIINRNIPGVDSCKVHNWTQYAEEFYRVVSRDEAEKYFTSKPELRRVLEKIGDGSGEKVFHIAFTGNIGTAQGLDILPKAAERLRDIRLLDDHNGIEDTVKKIRFVIVGDGRYQSSLEQEIELREVSDYFTFIPRQESGIIPYILALCDAAFVSFSNEKLWEMTIPAKLQSYMACGMPIIAAAGGETRRVIEEAGCGEVTRIGDADALADAIEYMSALNTFELKKLCENSRIYAQKYFNKDILMGEMEGWISAVIEKSATVEV